MIKSIACPLSGSQDISLVHLLYFINFPFTSILLTCFFEFCSKLEYCWNKANRSVVALCDFSALSQLYLLFFSKIVTSHKNPCYQTCNVLCRFFSSSQMESIWLLSLEYINLLEFLYTSEVAISFLCLYYYQLPCPMLNIKVFLLYLEHSQTVLVRLKKFLLFVLISIAKSNLTVLLEIISLFIDLLTSKIYLSFSDQPCFPFLVPLFTPNFLFEVVIPFVKQSIIFKFWRPGERANHPTLDFIDSPVVRAGLQGKWCLG